MKRLFSTTLLIIFTAAMLVSCAAPTPTTAPVHTEAPLVNSPQVVETKEPTEAPMEKIVVTDALNRTVEFDEYPNRIMIVGKAAFMPLDAAFLFPEAKERIIAYELRSQTGLDFIKAVYPESEKMTVMEMDSGPEQIAPLKPDLVIMKSYLKEKLGDQIEQLGIKVVYLDLESPEQISRDIQTLGQVFGNQARADELNALINQQTMKVTDVSSNIAEEDKPSVLVAMYSDKGGEIAFSVPPMNYLQYQLVEMAGGTPVWKDIPTDGWTVVTLEQIAAWNPDAIFIIQYQGKGMEVVGILKSDSNWMLLDAVKNDKIYGFPLDFQSWDQPDTRWTLGLAWMAARLHPYLYPNFNLLEETKNFYRNFYGLSDQTINDQIVPLLKGDF
jgi:iron complex transport system substrate-binding protein